MYACSSNSFSTQHLRDLSIPLLVPPPSLRLQEPWSTAPSTSEVHEYVLQRNSKKKTWQLLGFEQETAEDEEDQEEEVDAAGSCLSRKKTAWKLPGFEQEAAEDEEDQEEEAGHTARSLLGSCFMLDKEADGHHILVASLKGCAARRDIQKGCKLHIECVKKGLLESRIFVGNTLVDMYGKCGLLAEAEDVFQNLPYRTVVSWTALLAGYAQYGHGEDALMCFQQMQQENVNPNGATYLSILKACANLGAAEKCHEIHLRVAEDGLENGTSIGTALVDMYAKCGLLEQAKEVFDKIIIRNVISFGAILSGFVRQGLDEEALQCFEQLQHEGLYPNAVIFICVLKACGNLEAIGMGKMVHTEVVKVGFLEDNVMLSNAVLEMYAKCMAFIEARDVFNKLSFRDLVSWNSLITGYVQNGNGEEAFALYEEMQHHGFSPDVVTLTGIAKACVSLDAESTGQQVHAEALKKGVFDEVVMGSAIIEMYSTCGLLAEARDVFDNLQSKSVVLWNALIAGYVQHGFSEEALSCWDEMQAEGFSPTALTLASILKACAHLGAADKGEKILAQLYQEDLKGLDMVAGTALLDMYAKCGLIEKAQEVFDKLSVRDLVSWSALITGHAEEGRGEEALECFENMQLEGLSPNTVTFVGILKACGSIGAAFKGRQIHADILQTTQLEQDSFVGTSLVDMYGKCGLIVQAKEVFHKLPYRNILSWNALLAGYSQVGESQNVFKCYNAMVAEGLRPSAVTFIIIFNACSHAGLLDRGQLYFEGMTTSYGLIPAPEHYNCMVDMFGRAGQVEKMVKIVQEMLATVTITGWNIVLAACQRDVYYKAFIHLSKIYAAAAVK